MRSRLLRSDIALVVFVLLALGIPLSITIVRGEVARLESAVLADAATIAAAVEEPLEEGLGIELGPATQSYVEQSGSRVVVTDADGISVADTGGAVPRDFSTRPEVGEALAGRRSTGQRESETLGTELLYIAVPVVSGGDVLGVVRITYPTAAVERRIVAQLGLVGIVGLVVLGTAVAVSIALARWTSRPLARIEDAVDRFAQGDLTARAEVDDGPPEVVALGARIDQMATRIGDLLEAQRGFAADASHQLRTPLTALRLELETLQDVTADPALLDGLDRALDGTRRLVRTIDGLLAIARLEGQRPPLEPVDGATILRDTAELWDALAAEAGVTIQVAVADAVEVAPAVGVPHHIAQILDVVTDNALAAAPEGSVVLLAADVVDGHVELSVTDQGPGVDAETREHAFERRWQGPAPTGGTGLGLTIARRLADAAGAVLRLEDGPADRGLRVVARLGRP